MTETATVLAQLRQLGDRVRLAIELLEGLAPVLHLDAGPGARSTPAPSPIATAAPHLEHGDAFKATDGLALIAAIGSALGPVSSGYLVHATGFPLWRVRRAMRDLTGRRAVIKLGSSRSRLYALPSKPSATTEPPAGGGHRADRERSSDEV